MEKIFAILAVLLLLPLALADNNTTDPNLTIELPDVNLSDMNMTDVNLSDVNMTDIGEKLDNMSETGVEPVDSVTDFLMNASPYLLLIVGIVLIVLSGFGKLIGVILVILALLRIAWILFLGG